VVRRGVVVPKGMYGAARQISGYTNVARSTLLAYRAAGAGVLMSRSSPVR
jgi:hypothetical protein